MKHVINDASALVAVLVALLGGLVALDQVTLPARLRRTQAWATAAAATETDETKREVLRRVASRAAARLVGSAHVPAPYFVEVAAWLAVGPAWVANNTRSSTASRGETITILWFAFVAIATAGRRGIRIYLERQRIIREFDAGRTAISPPRLSLLHQMEGGTRIEFLWASILGVGAVAIGAGIGLVLRDHPVWWSLLLLICGSQAVYFVAEWLYKQGLAKLV